MWQAPSSWRSFSCAVLREITQQIANVRFIIHSSGDETRSKVPGEGTKKDRGRREEEVTNHET